MYQLSSAQKPSVFRTVAVVSILAGVGAVAAHAQWLNYPVPGVPRLANGKVDLSAKAPRTREGRPDLSGVWQTELETADMIASRSKDEGANALIVPGDDPRTFSRYFFNILAGLPHADAP